MVKIISFIGCEKKVEVAEPDIVVPEAKIIQPGYLGEELIQAVDDGDLVEVESLIVKGADVNFLLSGFEWDVYSLSIAATEGHTKIVELLINAGADFNKQLLKDWYDGHSSILWEKGTTAIDILKSSTEYSEIIQQLLETGAVD